MSRLVQRAGFFLALEVVALSMQPVHAADRLVLVLEEVTSEMRPELAADVQVQHLWKHLVLYLAQRDNVPPASMHMLSRGPRYGAARHHAVLTASSATLAWSHGR